MNLLTGCIVDSFDPNEPVFAPEHHGSILIRTESYDLREHMPTVRQQKKNNCCAHGVKSALVGQANLEQDPIAEPSVDFLYVIAQVVDRPKQELRDDGSSLRQMARGMARRNIQGPGGLGVGFGIATELAWPETEEHAIPPDDVWRYAEACTLGGYSFITDGPRSFDLIDAAMRRGRLPTIAFLVDEKFSQTTHEVYNIPGGRIIGSHCMVCCGYSKVLDAILVQNSWSQDFGDRGYVWISRDFVNRSTYGKMIVEGIRGRAII